MRVPKENGLLEQLKNGCWRSTVGRLPVARRIALDKFNMTDKNRKTL